MVKLKSSCNNAIQNCKLDLFTREENPIIILPNYDGKLVLKEKLYINSDIPRNILDSLVLLCDELDYNRILIKDDLIGIIDSTKSKSLVKLNSSLKNYLEKIKISELIKDGKSIQALLRVGLFRNNATFAQQKKLWTILEVVYSNLIVTKSDFATIDLTEYDKFDNLVVYDTLIKLVLYRYASADNPIGFSKMDDVSNLIANEEYSNEVAFHVDNFQNSVIEYVSKYNASLMHEHKLIPDQNNILHYAGDDLSLDVRIKYFDEETTINETLKNILLKFSSEVDFRSKLVHRGVNYSPSKKLDTSDICKQLDESVIKARDSQDELLKQNIRDLDNWISNKVIDIEQDREALITVKQLQEWFGRFYDTRAGIAYNTLSLDQKEKSSKIIHSGHLSEFSEIVTILENNNSKDKDGLLKIMMKSVKDENDKIMRTKFYRGLGSSVENIFSDLLGGKAIKLDFGQDFILLNEFEEIGIRLEIKSRSKHGDFVYMTKKQVKTAVEFSGDYILCVYPDVSDSSSSGFKEKSRFVLDVSSIVESKYSSTQSFINKNIENLDKDLVEVEFENRSYKYKLDQRIWKRNISVLNYDQFSEFIKLKLQTEKNKFAQQLTPEGSPSAARPDVVRLLN